MAERGQQQGISVVFNKRFHLLFPLCLENRARAIEQSAAGTHHRPQRFEQLFLNGSELGNIALTSQPADVWMPPHNARSRARCI